MVFSADCVPILLHDPIRNVVGAIHAGWRGTAENIAGDTVRKMVSEFGCAPGEISAAIGPCISKCCYETDRDVVSALIKALGEEEAAGCITTNNSKYMVDLKETNRLLLQRSGLCDIMVSEECTSCQNDKYWSHRRTNGQRGSQAAIIGLLTNQTTG
jgi:YfiH family protein